MSWNGRRQQGNKGRTGKRYVQDGTSGGTSAGAPSLVPLFLISFFFVLFCFQSRPVWWQWRHQRTDYHLCRLAASFCARLTGRRMDVGRWLHLLSPPGWLVPHFTVTANPEKGQPASQHGPLVTVKSWNSFYSCVDWFLVYWGGRGLCQGCRLCIFPSRGTFVASLLPCWFTQAGQLALSFPFAACLLHKGLTEQPGWINCLLPQPAFMLPVC